MTGYLPSILSPPPKCKECTTPERAVRMEATEAWHPTLYETVDAWECPECGRQVVREEEPL